jgi:hypothetical protein
MPPQGSLGNVQGFAHGGMVRGFQNGGVIGLDPYAPIKINPRAAPDPRSYAARGTAMDVEMAQRVRDRAAAQAASHLAVRDMDDAGRIPPIIDAPIHSTFTSPLVKSGILSDAESQANVVGGAPDAAISNLNLPTAPTFDPVKPFSAGVATNLAAIDKRRGDPLAKFQQVLDDRKAEGEEVDDSRFWRDVAKAGFATAAGTSQYALENVAAGGGTFLEARDKSEAITTARRDKDLQLGLTLATAKEDLFAKRQQIAMALQKGNIDVEAANQAGKMAVSEFKLSTEKVAQAERLADKRTQATLAAARIQAEAPTAFTKTADAIAKMPTTTPKERKAKADRLKLHKMSLDRRGTGMRLTRSQATAASNRRNKRFDEVLDYNKSGDAKNSKIMNTEVTKGMTVGEALQSMDDAKIQKAMPIIRAMVDKEMESDADYLEGVALGYIKPYKAPKRDQTGFRAKETTTGS